MHMIPVWVMEIDRKRLEGIFLDGEWCDRRWMNTPGPIYTGKADFALLGPTLSPGFIALDDEQVDVVFRQPMTTHELDRVLKAAEFDPFSGYAVDGNNNWTVSLVREWWSLVSEIRRHIVDHLLNSSWWRHRSEVPLIRRIGEAWLQFLDKEARLYLREYLHFLELGSWPSSEDALPDL